MSLPIVPDLIAGLLDPQPPMKPAPPAPADTARFAAHMRHLARAAWPSPSSETAARLLIVLDALERADVDGSAYLIDHRLTELFQLMRQE